MGAELISQALLVTLSSYLCVLLLLAGFSKTLTAATFQMRALGVFEIALGGAVAYAQFGSWPNAVMWLLFSVFLLLRIRSMLRRKSSCGCFGAVVPNEDAATAVGTGIIWWTMAGILAVARFEFGAFGEPRVWRVLGDAYIAGLLTLTAFTVYGWWIRSHRRTELLREAN